MKWTVMRPIEIEVNYVEMLLPVDDDDIQETPELNDMLAEDDDRVFLSVRVDSGEVIGTAPDCDICLKVRDSGTYRLFDSQNNMVAERVEDYVPNCLIPGDYGDYVELTIRGNKVANWPKTPRLSDFFPEHD